MLAWNRNIVDVAKLGDFVAVKMRLQEGKDINERDFVTGATPLIEACKHGRDMEMIEYLVERKPKLNMQDKDGCTALMHAVQAGHVRIVTFLIDKGADLNVQDKYGSTPVIWATFKNKFDMVMLLIDKGADLLIEDTSGRTAVKYAEERGFKDRMIQRAHLRAVSTKYEEALAKKNPPTKKEYFYKPDPDPGIYWDDIRTK